MRELKPCPFCGGEAELHSMIALTYSEVRCECGASVKGEYSSSVKYALHPDGGYHADHIAFTAWNRRADRWISVQERLPQVGEPVLVWLCLKKYIDIRIFWGSGAESIWREHYTHWRPLPSPPEGVERG